MALFLCVCVCVCIVPVKHLDTDSHSRGIERRCVQSDWYCMCRPVKCVRGCICNSRRNVPRWTVAANIVITTNNVIILSIF